MLPMKWLVAAFLAASSGSWGPTQAQTVAPGEVSRGEMLYTTHCIACHTAQVHWRERKVAQDWTGLVAAVHRWQGNANLGWNDGDIDEVARFLDARYYRYGPGN